MELRDKSKMRISIIKNAINNYEINKGKWRILFGSSQADIQKLSVLVEYYGPIDRALKPHELFELSELLLTHETCEGSLSRMTFNSLQQAMFGCVVSNKESAASILEAFKILSKHDLLTNKNIKAVCANRHPQTILDMLRTLQVREGLLTQENFNHCLQAEDPLQLAVVFNALSKHHILTPENRGVAHGLVKYRFKLPSLLEILQKYDCPEEYIDKILEQPCIIPALHEYFDKLRAVPLDVLDADIVKTSVELTLEETDKVKEAEKLKIQKIFAAFDFKLTRSDSIEMGFKEAYNRTLSMFNVRSLDEAERVKKLIETYPDKYRYKTSEPYLAIDLRTKENLQALLARVSFIDKIYYKFQDAYKRSAEDQVSAQFAFNQIINECDRTYGLQIESASSRQSYRY